MKNFFKRMIESGTTGLMFQGAVVQFTPLSGGTNNLAGPLSQYFTSTNLPGLFNAIFTMALSAGAILAVLQLARAGWLYMSSDAFGTKSKAKEIIRDAILGLVLLIGIWIILNQINPCLLNLNILQTIQGGSSTCQTS